jgi:hypothetical protein
MVGERFMPLRPEEEFPSTEAPSLRVVDSCACVDVRKLGHKLHLHDREVQYDKRKMVFFV